MKKKNTHSDEGFKVPKDYFDNFEEKIFDKISQEDKDTSLLSDELTSGLKTPEGYFDAFEDQLIKKLNADDSESSNLADNLKTGLITPNKYFENVEDTILEKTIKANQETKIIPLFSRKNVLFITGIAAMIAIIISVSINKGNDPFNFDTIDVADIQEYFDEGNVEFSDTEIAELLDEEASFIDTFNDDEISDEELENYLSGEELTDEIIYVE